MAYKPTLMKALSVRQPYAALICAGVKTVENRSRPTNYRGKLLIHASGNPMAIPNFDYLPEKFDKEWSDRWDRNDWNSASISMSNFTKLFINLWNFYDVDAVNGSDEDVPTDKELKKLAKEQGCFLPAQTVIGFCDLVDCVQNSKDDFAEEGCFHWILENPRLFTKPIDNVLGHLQIWNLDISSIDIYSR
jgi:hypothetical protein